MSQTPKITKMVVSYTKPRKKPQEGDTKTLKDGTVMVRRQAFSERERAYLVKNGRPVYEWVRHEDL